MFLAAAAFASVVVRNDTNYDDTYDQSDGVLWMEYPECAIAVLEADADDLPLEIDSLQIYFGSSTGNDDGTDTLAEVGLQVLADGEDPNPTHFEWGPEGFYVTVSSTDLNVLYLEDEENGLYALDYTEGRIAVWFCPPDPTTGEAWPREGRDQTGVVFDTDSPSAGNWVSDSSGSVYPAAEIGVTGSFIIRAVDLDAGGGGGGGDDTGGGGGGDDTGDGGGGGDDAGLSLTSITPADASEGETVDVTVLGTGIEEGATVFIGGLAASSVAFVSDTAVTAKSPSALPVGTHDVVLNNPDGGSATLTGSFTVHGGCGCGGVPGAPFALAIAVAWALPRRRQAP
ncbi:MAG: IPT/TIG domain-containing protein [Myxococcota bacterium]